MFAHSARLPDWIVNSSVRVRTGNSGGSGTVVEINREDETFIVITNRHVCPQPGAPVRVFFPDGRNVAGVSLGPDDKADLACLEMHGQASNYVPLAEASPKNQTGIYQCGYPSGKGPIQRQGYALGMHSYSRTAWNLDLQCVSYYGDSGSGIFRQTDGRLIGVLWGGADGSSSSAVPVEYCHGFLKRMRERIQARRDARSKIRRPGSPGIIPPPKGADSQCPPPPIQPPQPPYAPPTPAPPGNPYLPGNPGLADLEAKVAMLKQEVDCLKYRPGTPGPVGPQGPKGEPGEGADLGLIAVLRAQIAQQRKEIDDLKTQTRLPGPMGPAGPKGEPGQSVDVDKLAAILQRLETQNTKLNSDVVALQSARYTAELLDTAGNVRQRVEFGKAQPLKLKLIPVKPN